MKVLVIGYMHPKYDKRVFRTVKALSKKQFVIYQYWTDNQYEKSYIEGNIQYEPLYYVKNMKISILKKLLNRVMFDKKIIEMIRHKNYDILYLHYYIVTYPIKAFKIAKKIGKVIIFDIHEYHPENLSNNFLIARIVTKLNIMWKIFKKQLILSDKLIFVSEEMRNDCFKQLKIKKESMVLKNYANDIGKIKSRKEKTIVYVGKSPRNLSLEIKILKELINYGFSFKTIGTMDEIKDIHYTKITFLPYSEMVEELSKSAFSLISYTSYEKNSKSKNVMFSLPHKYFDSIAATTPVIVKDSMISISKDVQKYRIGVIINPSNIKESIKKILDAYKKYDYMMENIEKYKRNFIWTNDKEEKFIKFVINNHIFNG